MQKNSPSDIAKLDDQRFQLLVEGVTDYAIYMLDPDGFVRTWNTGAERLTGYRADEIIGQHFSRFFTKDDLAAGLPARALREAAKVGRFEAEGWRLRKDGTRFWANTVLDTLRADNGDIIGFAKVTRDISERKAAQETLLESERRFRMLVEGVTDYAIFMLDPNGVVTNWNAGAERMKGYRASDIVGQHFSCFYGKEDRQLGRPIIALEVARLEGRYESEGWRYRKDGSRFWASAVIDRIRDANGQLMGFAKITRDITERKSAQDALQESEGQFRMLVEGVTDYAIYMLDPNGIITKWNRGAERIKGYRAAEIIGQHFSRFYTEQDRSDGLPARALQIAAKEGRFEAEGWRVRKDGARLWANVVIDVLRDPSGELIGFAKITRDITEKRAAQISLQKAQEQRNRAQRMEALGQLTGGVAHDFNNLLMIVSGHLGPLKNIAGEDEKASRAVAAIEGAMARGQSLTRQLLTFSRRQSLNPVSTEVGAQLDSCRSMFDSLIGASGRIAISIDRDVWPVLIDADEFELALLNLVVNARDALKAGGIVSISARNARLTAQDAVEGLTGDFVALSVEDTGHGIPPDILPRIFDPFFTTKSPDRGTGLGLAQVHGFVHQSGGTITARSELGLGTNFTLYLPRADAAPSPAESEPTLLRGEGRRMLLVEDNPAVAEASLLLVEELGFSPQVAPNAATALEALEQGEFSQGEFSIVVSDIVMAGEMDGLQLAQAIRTKYPTLPVILVSGYNERAEAARGQFIVLRKPYGAAELSRAIARARNEIEADGESNVVRFNPTHLSR